MVSHIVLFMIRCTIFGYTHEMVGCRNPGDHSPKLWDDASISSPITTSVPWHFVGGTGRIELPTLVGVFW